MLRLAECLLFIEWGSMMSQNPNKEIAARMLAQMHYEFEPGMVEIFRLIDEGADECNPSEPIKLLEVNQDTIPSGILPLGFDPIPASGNFPSVVIQITPGEFERVKKGELQLPSGWRISQPPFPSPARNEAI